MLANRLTAELDRQIEAQTAENIAAGMSAGEARATWSSNRIERLGPDIRLGLRTLAGAPRFTMIAVLLMALAIGACSRNGASNGCSMRALAFGQDHAGLAQRTSLF